ncbi:MAG: hypothetical protein OHK0015_38050 [Chloroflexi bacterium OHK40]
MSFSDRTRPLDPRHRSFFALAIGMVAGIVCWWARVTVGAGSPGDFVQVLYPAQALLRGSDPLAIFYEGYVPYPLTAALLGLPFAGLPLAVGSGLLAGLAAALLAYMLLAEGQLWRLLLFGSFPFFYALVFAQFTPLITALALAGCAPLGMLLKPQNALPLLLTYPSQRWSFVAAGLIVAGSLLLRPTWPLVWIERAREYSGAIPMLVLPGPLLALALLRWRSPRARQLLLMACMPQRSYYDAVALWLIPQTRGGMLVLTLCSWLALLFPHLPLMLLACYLPALAVLLWEGRVAPATPR